MQTAAQTAPFFVHRVHTPADVTRWEAPFASAYQAVFQGEPYRESFSLDTAVDHFRRLTRLTDHITLVAADEHDAVHGFGIAVPLHTMKTIAPRLEGLVPVRQTYYLAELGVLPTARGLGLGRELIRHRIRLMDRDRYSHVVLRVSDTAGSSAAMYRALDFEDMGVSMSVTRQRTDGEVREDRRNFLCRLLSQVDIH